MGSTDVFDCLNSQKLYPDAIKYRLNFTQSVDLLTRMDSSTSLMLIPQAIRLSRNNETHNMVDNISNFTP